MQRHSARQFPIEILSGPFGSEAAKCGSSTREIFARGRLETARDIHRRFHAAGVTTGVTSTFAAAPRGLREQPFDEEYQHWNRSAVAVAREFYGDKILASVAPLLDTSGGDDEAWSRLDVDWARRRHQGQVTTLRENGATRVLGEAFRYVGEAKALAKLLEELGFTEFVCSFEARHPEGRLPHQPKLTYEQVKNEIVLATHGNLQIGIGVNCAGADDCTRALMNENPGVIDAVYPNRANIRRNRESERFIKLAERNGTLTPGEKREFEFLRKNIEDIAIRLPDLAALCLEKRVRYAGVCCGGTPEDVATLRNVLEKATHSSNRLS